MVTSLADILHAASQIIIISMVEKFEGVGSMGPFIVFLCFSKVQVNRVGGFLDGKVQA